MKVGDRRIEIYKGPDSLGRYQWALFWVADYHPGHPKGKHRVAERGQMFFGRIMKKYNSLPTKDCRNKPGTPLRSQKMPGDYYVYQGSGNVFVHSEATADKAIEWAKTEHLSWKQIHGRNMRYRVFYNGFQSHELYDTDNPEASNDTC